MIKEFAVDPLVMGSSWNKFLYLIEKFGFDRGRIIARLPSNWESEVKKAALEADISDIRLASITNRLNQAARRAVAKRPRIVNPALGDWTANAIHGADRGVYHAIIAEANDTNHQSILVADDITEDTELFRAQRSWEVPRTVEGICQSARPFLMNAKAVLIVDPYFNAQSGGQDFLGPLQKILRTVVDADIAGCKVQLHFATIDRNPSLNFYEGHLKSVLKPILPLPRHFEMYEWGQRHNEIQFHDRHLLTDCGGLTFGAGFSAVAPGQQLGVSLLDWEDNLSKIRRFVPETAAFNLVGQGLRINVDGTSKRIVK